MSELTFDETEYEYAGSDAGCAHAYLLREITELIKGFRSVGPILDLGCGNGSLSHELSKLGFDVHGLDRSESGIGIARQSFPDVRFTLGDVEADLKQTALGAETFDIVVSTEVIEHLYHPHRLVHNAFQLLKPSGHFIISTPYHGYFKNLALALTGRLDNHFTALWEGGHIKFWSRDSLSRLLRTEGFTEVRFVGAGRVPYLWKSMILIGRKVGAT